MIRNLAVDEKILYQSNWLQKQAKIRKYNRNIKYMHQWLQTLNKYNIANVMLPVYYGAITVNFH